MMGVMGALKLDGNFPFIPFIPFVPILTILPIDPINLFAWGAYATQLHTKSQVCTPNA